MFNRENLKELLLDVNKTMQEIGYEYFLLHGTLLGYYRDKDIIPWDDDIDLGIKLEPTEEVRKKLIDTFEKKDYIRDTWIKETEEFPNACNIIFNTYVKDVFVKQGNLRNTYITIAFKFVKRISDRIVEADSPVTYDWKDIRRLKQVKFLGDKFNIPDEPENLFDIWYGKDCWKVPSRRAWIMKPRDKADNTEPIKFYHDQAKGYRAGGVIEALLKCDKDGNYIQPYEQTGKTPR